MISFKSSVSLLFSMVMASGILDCVIIKLKVLDCRGGQRYDDQVETDLNKASSKTNPITFSDFKLWMAKTYNASNNGFRILFNGRDYGKSDHDINMLLYNNSFDVGDDALSLVIYKNKYLKQNTIKTLKIEKFCDVGFEFKN